MSAASKAAKAVELAERELTAATDTHTRWTVELDTGRASLDAARQRAGAAVLDDPDAAGATARELAELAGSVEVGERACAAAVERVAPLRRAVLSARAAVHTERADKIAAAREALQGKVDKLLGELTALQGGAIYALDRGRPKSVYPVYDEGRAAPVADTDRLATAEREERALAERLTRLVESGTDDQVAAALTRVRSEPSHVARELAGVR